MRYVILTFVAIAACETPEPVTGIAEVCTPLRLPCGEETMEYCCPEDSADGMDCWIEMGNGDIFGTSDERQYPVLDVYKVCIELEG